MYLKCFPCPLGKSCQGFTCPDQLLLVPVKVSVSTVESVVKINIHLSKNAYKRGENINVKQNRPFVLFVCQIEL